MIEYFRGEKFVKQNQVDECEVVHDTKDCPGRNAEGVDISGYQYSINGLPRDKCDHILI